MTKKFIAYTLLFILHLTISFAENSRYFSFDKGIVPLIYHRFEEPKYPSTNIQMDVFKKQIEIITERNYNFYNLNSFENFFLNPNKQKKILLTIDDAFTSFYENAWPYLKEKKIPFILFVSTEPMGKYGYMNWDQIREIEKEDFVLIGNHSHSHEYLVNYTFEDFKKDIDMSIRIFKKELGYNPIFFSYPFGEYSLEHKKYIKQKFKYAFGQHSGVIDLTKDKFELPRFPINEKYGELKRFSSIISYYPLPYKKLTPEDKLVKGNNNPPIVYIEFFEDQKNIERINCFSNEGDEWGNPKIEFSENKMIVKFRDKFKFRRGRLNCSLNDEGKWRWFGTQFIIKED
jgi:peptidoglycan/xylan/chitin deacetylase (PgdA/CDA1 family)|tara:strand:+ start:755 stop:1786 length:1032 start_codon:yes stop_codon:yes gene_type:complete